MSKKFLPAIAPAVCVTAVFIAVGGCYRLSKEDRFVEFRVPARKLRQIEVIDMNEMEVEHREPNNPAPAASEPNDITEMPADISLTLEEARAGALQNNLQLKVSLMAPVIAQAAVLAEEAKFEAAFFANLNHLRSDQPAGTIVEIPGTSTFVASIRGSQRMNTSLDFGVQIPLQTGGTITFDLADSRNKNLESNSLLSPWYANDVQISISQPLLRNAGRRANMHSIRIARYQRQIQDNATKLEVIGVLAAVDRAYWRLYAARRELEVRKQQHDLAVAQLARARRFVDAGQQAHVEILRAEAGVARQLAAIITAENDLRDRQREFKRTINRPGMGVDSSTVIFPATEPDPVYYDLDRDKLKRLAVENRTELLDLELQIARSISTIDFMNNQALPLATLTYTYNINGTGPTRTDSLDMLNDKHFEDHMLGVRLWVPLGNAQARNNLRRALLQRRQLLANRKSTIQLIHQEVLNAVDQVEANWQHILASRQRVILEARLLETEIHQFEVGLRTSTDVLEAQTNFADAQSEEITALANYQISLVDLAYATGTLLGAAKVEWEPVTPQTGIRP